MSAVVGIDPGGNETGIVLCDGSELLRAWIVDRERQSHEAYTADVIGTVREAARIMQEALGTPEWHASTGHGILMAVEGVVEPTGHLGMIRLGGLLRTAMVFGACLGMSWSGGRAVIEPKGNGSHPFDAYPQQLRPTRVGARGKDQLRHCRSAWDVAQIGHKRQQIAHSA